jgi:hypothetical protein
MSPSIVKQLNKGGATKVTITRSVNKGKKTKKIFLRGGFLVGKIKRRGV